MARNAPLSRPKDPRELPVQVSIRLPYWYREQLEEQALKTGYTLPGMVLVALEKVYPPKSAGRPV